MDYTGLVVEERKNYYGIALPSGRVVKGVLKGVIRKTMKRLAVGDRVTVELFDEEMGEAVIRKAEKRFNQLPRPVVANVDQVLFINCLAEPALDFNYMDRFLFGASVEGVAVHLLLNKIDLLLEEEMELVEDVAAIYEEAGYGVSLISVETEEGIAEVRSLLEGRVTIFAGPSGVGKSSLMKRLFPDHEFITNTLSEGISRGRNTTTHTQLLPLNPTTFVADTPGFSYMMIPRTAPADVSAHFPDLLALAPNCRFSNCLHRKEPGCGVHAGLEEGIIEESRYGSYLGLLAMMEDAEKDYAKKDMRYIA